MPTTDPIMDAIRDHAPRCHRCGADARPDDRVERAPDHPWRWQHVVCPERGAVPLPRAA